ncbi:unnamed protein product [Ambrosiozyma monospora]|uniref:Unnamed protein product n=1 Tax=Ambrosiozyma monospora TaxID=43982 RepID=A0ACB5T6F9_AMBMO|nr:unnamed protein product [Ambrosiozyma monospora]
MGLKNIFSKKRSPSASAPSQPTSTTTSTPTANTPPTFPQKQSSTNDSSIPNPKGRESSQPPNNNSDTNQSYGSGSGSGSSTVGSSSAINGRPRARTRRSTISEQKRISSIPTSFLRQSNTLSPNYSDNSYNSSSLDNKNSNSTSHKRVVSSVSSASRFMPALDASASNVPEELIPIVTLINAQQARTYCEMFVQVPLSQIQQQPSNQHDNTEIPTEWSVVSAKLSGTELGIWEMDDTTAMEARNDDNGGFKPIYINVADSEFAYETNDDPILKKKCFDLKIWLTNEKMYWIRFANKEDAEFMYSSLLLSQFEFKQLQESFTGALLSSKAIHFSDIRTLLAPNNKHERDEWCVVRFPFLNNKWIRCFVVVVPRASKKKHGKIEFYTSSNRNKKNLLASLVNVRTCSSVYPENPSFIDSNSLLRITGENYINEELLNKVISGEINTDGSRSRSSSMAKSTSLKKKRSTGSLMSLGKKNNSNSNGTSSPMHSRTNSLRTHSRQHSSMSVTSDPRATKKMSNATIIRTHLVS